MVPVLEQVQKLAEDLGHVATIDLVDDEEVGAPRISRRRIGDAPQRAGRERVRERSGRVVGSVPLEEILIAVRRMELANLGAAAVGNEVLGELGRDERLARARRAEEDELLLL